MSSPSPFTSPPAIFVPPMSMASTGAVVDLGEVAGDAAHVNARDRRGEPVQPGAAPDRPDLAAGEQPGDGGAAQAVADERDIGIGGAEHGRTPAVAGDQQGPLRRRRGNEPRLQVGAGRGGVTKLEAHRAADLDDVADRHRLPLLVDADHGADEVVAKVVLVRVLVHGDADLRSTGEGDPFLLREVADDLIQPAQGRLAGEFEHDVAVRRRHDHLGPDRTAALAHDHPLPGTGEQQPDGSPVDGAAVQEEARRAGPGRSPADAAHQGDAGQHLRGAVHE